MSTKNIVEMQDKVLEMFDAAVDGKLSTESLKGFNGSLGKMISSAAIQSSMSKQFDRPVYKETLDFMLDAKKKK